MNDIELIYSKLKDKYDLLLTNTFALDEGFTWDVPVICGKSRLGRFWLYADEDTPDPHGCDFVFSVEYEKHSHGSEEAEICYTHWHPYTVEEAVRDTEHFMMGTIILQNEARDVEAPSPTEICAENEKKSRMNKEFEAYYSPGYAWIFFGLAMAFLVAVGVLMGVAIASAWIDGFIISIPFAIVAVIFLCVFAWAIRKKGIAVEITDGKLILHKKKPVTIPLAEIYRISINDGNGSFDLSVKTLSKNYSIHCFMKDEQRKKQELIRLFKNRGVAVRELDLNGPG